MLSWEALWRQACRLLEKVPCVRGGRPRAAAAEGTQWRDLKARQRKRAHRHRRVEKARKTPKT